MKLPSIRFFYLMIAATMISACGNKKEPEPLPRLVKVVVVGQSSNDSVSAESNKEPGALRFDASGKVIEVLAKAGDGVIPGQSLARLIPSSISTDSSVMIQYRAAKADLQSAEADFKRYEDLKNKKFISASEFDRRVASVETARAKYEQSIEAIGFVTLRAMDAGRLSEFKLSVGQIISVQDVVGRIQFNQAAAAQKNKTPQGKAEKVEKAIYIPATAIHSDGKSVYKVQLDKDSTELGTLVLAELELGRVNDVSAEVLKGLIGGDRVIATGWHALSVGQKVRIALTEKAQ